MGVHDGGEGSLGEELLEAWEGHLDVGKFELGIP